ncbi:hypothetical protein Shyhy01_43350 [Streptomyces hygroscopicus subsp. hygroscopicus]|nr:hypothetical protein Shyhy01_43350 [Streptomyces hygroscopicus subsp. hygroscopicus]
MPPWELIHLAYARAIAGMPGLLVAPVSCGAQVMTLTGSAAPVTEGRTPHPAVSEAHRATAPRDRAAALPGREEAEGRGDVLRVRGLPVMDPHDSLTPLTRE